MYLSEEEREMKYILYGANRVAKDFLYMFEDLQIVYFIDDEYEGRMFLGYPVARPAELNKRMTEEQIILCDFDKTKKETRLLEMGLVYGKDYLYEEDFFDRLDSFVIPKERKIAIWGIGRIAGQFCNAHPEYDPETFIDSRPKEETYRNKRVVLPKEIDDWTDRFVIVCVAKDEEIKEWLAESGLKESRDYVSYQKLTGIPSKLLKETIFDRAYYDLECNTMRNHLEIFHGGNTRCCCTTFVEQNLDNMMDYGVDELWKSNLHKVLCLSTENRTYTFCEKTMCPLFVAKRKEEARCTEGKYKKMTEYPETIALGYDATCNLSCVTCRQVPYVARGREREKMSEISRRVKENYLKRCKFLILAGDGEVFLSPAYKEIYLDKNCNPEYIRLLTNGMLFNKKTWEQFADGKSSKVMLTVSVDAASEATYEKIRKNGNFAVLAENMKYASELRRKGELSYFRMNFVVQRENYQEMPLFVEWGEELGVDEVFFTKILNWGTYTEEEFSRVSMMEADGITPKPELREVIEQPVMQSPIVDMGTIRYGHRMDEADVVENYYMWELEKRGGKLFS